MMDTCRVQAMTDLASFPLQGKPKQWCHLGCKALEKYDYRKAVMLLNMSLHLSDVNTEPAIKTQTYHALAEAYFSINEYERALDAGRNCFKLHSVKSEVQLESFIMREVREKSKKKKNGSDDTKS